MDHTVISHILIFTAQMATLIFQWKNTERRRKWRREDMKCPHCNLLIKELNNG